MWMKTRFWWEFAIVFFRNGQPTRDGHHGSQSEAGESFEATEFEPRYSMWDIVIERKK